MEIAAQLLTNDLLLELSTARVILEFRKLLQGLGLF